MNAMRGKLIVFEGLDGSGHTTQAGLLAAWLRTQGANVMQTAEPTEGPLGRVLRRYLAGQLVLDIETAALTFAADRLDHCRVLAQGLDRGDWVICDRYVASSFAYQGSQGLDCSWLEEINTYAFVPDLTLYLDVPVATCLERIAARGAGGGRFETREQLERVKAAYRDYFRLGRHGEVAVLDGSGPPDAVHAAVLAVLRRRQDLVAAR